MADCSAVVATFRQRHTAEMAQGFLADAGIDAAVSVDDAGAMYAGLTFGPSGARLMVRPDQVRKARRVLAEAGMVGGDADSGESGDSGAGEETAGGGR